MSPKSNTDNTEFGFQTVLAEQKSHLVRGVFDSIANRYDLMNDLMSLGVHRLWKNALLDWVVPRKDAVLLDVAGGTGDIAQLYFKRGGNRATICDINSSMIDIGRQRVWPKSTKAQLSWICGDAEKLPIADKSIDFYTIAFGLRNVTRIDQALYEAHRVLKPGGRFFCLEFSKPNVFALNLFYDNYSFKLIPKIGQLITGNEGAYKYLIESIRLFPDQQELKKLISTSGLSRVKYRNLSGGIAAIHSAWRL